ncbi:hypothetical protein ACLMAL_12530 [Nocardia sp. CWNU-33]|uniref:hypothetical protein n=1 Tax=Nocardia sp. CWNU-33 TaxID=3392117 RepID=UPI00398F6442
MLSAEPSGASHFECGEPDLMLSGGCRNDAASTSQAVIEIHANFADFLTPS